MQFLVILPIWILIVFAVAAIAGMYAFMQALPFLIVILIIVIILGFLWVSHPIATTIGYVALCIFTGVMVLLFGNNGLVSTNVEIYRATGQCVFYDEEYIEHTIDEGTIFAMYDDDKEHSKEKYPKTTSALVAWRTYCIVHNENGGNTTYYVAAVPEMKDSITLFGVSLHNRWKREKVADITKMELQSTSWWKLGEASEAT